MHSAQSKSGSRTPSPTSELISDAQPKDSPTPDRDSLHIDMVASNQDTAMNRGETLVTKTLHAVSDNLFS